MRNSLNPIRCTEWNGMLNLDLKALALGLNGDGSFVQVEIPLEVYERLNFCLGNPTLHLCML